jgi:AraC family transcriptional regulator of adaptative response / DNA-3-methyladenine glycosylase II
MENLTDQDYQKIIARRDPKYDGRFYFAVVTTGIYCRPICPARPKPENIRIFHCASQAESKGYRPCKRCKPDLAPQYRINSNQYSIVARAMEEIEKTGFEALDGEDLNVANLAKFLNISARHLSRSFDEYLGVSPVSVINTRRLHLARQFLSQTSFKVTEIAFAVGFNSVRRFNESFKKTYHQTPSGFRKSSAQAPEADHYHMSMMVRMPYDWSYVLNFLKRHACYGTEEVIQDKYRRYIALEQGGYGIVEVSFNKNSKALDVTFSNLNLSEIKPILLSLRKMFDVDHNPAHLPENSLPHKGVRIIGSFDAFETIVSIIMGQLITVGQALQKMKQLMEAYGRAIDAGKGIYEFPEPKDLKDVELEIIGMTKVKAGAIREIARQLDEGEISLTSLSDIEATQKQLLKIRGIGPWTVDMAAMRVLYDANAFPAGDLIIRRAIDAGLAEPKDWATSMGYLTHVIWRDYAERFTGKGFKNASKNKA